MPPQRLHPNSASAFTVAALLSDQRVSRHRIGLRKGDYHLGQGTTRLVTLADRKSSLTRIRRVSSGEAGTVARAIIHMMHPLAARVHAITRETAASSPNMRSSTLR